MRSITMYAGALTLTLALCAGAQAGEEEAVELDDHGRAIQIPKKVKRLEAHERGRAGEAHGTESGAGEDTTVLDEEGRSRATRAGAGGMQAAPEGGTPEQDGTETKPAQASAASESASEDQGKTQALEAHAPHTKPEGDTGAMVGEGETGEGKTTQTAHGHTHGEDGAPRECSLAGVRERSARRGERLIATVSRWGEEAGWTIVAKTKYDWPIEAQHHSRQRLDKAILELTESFKQVQPAPKATAYGRNCVIVIRDNAARSG